jgi:long-chain acyl-CoA synthetase
LRYEKFVHPLRFLHTLPLSHVFGQTMGLWIPPIFRAEVHFESRLVAPRLIETIHRERISVLAAVPRVFALLKSHLETSRPQLPERLVASNGISAWKRWWRFRGVHRSFGFKFWALISGGGALPPSVEQFWNGLGFVVVQGYGMTETTALITLNHPFHVARGTIGKPLPGREVKIGPDGEVLVRGPMISTATWSGGELRKHEDDWLATGDLAEKEPTGELRFLGRKSEVIVTGSGVNIHPEDLEAEIEEQPGVTACAVVPMDTLSGPEPCAVLAMRGTADQAGAAIENANVRLAEFQRVRRWMLWPEPDLPRTSTGKVRRKKVAEWLAETQRGTNGSRLGAPSIDSGDWLLAMIVEITREAPPGTDEKLRLAEDLHLDSLGRVQLAAAIEEKMGMPPESGLLEQVQTLGQLRRLVTGHEHRTVSGHEGSKVSGHDFSRADTSAQSTRALAPEQPSEISPAGPTVASETPSPTLDNIGAAPERALAPETHQSPSRHYIYPHWPWWPLVQWIRSAFIELVMRPLVWFLANPRVVAPPDLNATVSEPILIVANHITAYDGPLVQYALSGRLRRRIAIAMSGEMLDDFRHFRNPEQRPNHTRFFPFGPVAYFLVTALFNVFPLPRLRDFQRSFAHAGEALDRGYHVLLFPEGARSATGELARFRPGIGLLVKQSGTSVLPVAIRGLGELKDQRRGWFRSGAIELRVGQPIRFALDTTESSITERLQTEVKRLLEG